MKPLQGKRILVTRPAAQAAKLAEMITAQGGEPVRFPLVEISPVEQPTLLQESIARLDDFDIAVFISPNAVNFSVPLILNQRSWPTHVQTAAIGKSTAMQLAAYGIENIIVPFEHFDSEALLALSAFHADHVTGKRVLILRGNGGRELLINALRERGAHVNWVTCYIRSAPIDGEPILLLLRDNHLDAVTISSSEGLRNLLALLDTDSLRRLQTLPLFVSHQRIAKMATELGLNRAVLTGATDADTIRGLCTYNWLHHEREC